MGELGFCTVSDILKSVSVQILSDITTDVGIPIWLVRLLHNKVVSTVFYSLRCYLLYTDVNQLTFFLPVVLFPFIIYAFWEKRWRKIIISGHIIFPLFFILNYLNLNLQIKIMIFRYYYIILGLTGIVKCLLHLKSNRFRIFKRQ